GWMAPVPGESVPPVLGGPVSVGLLHDRSGVHHLFAAGKEGGQLPAEKTARVGFLPGVGLRPQLLRGLARLHPPSNHDGPLSKDYQDGGGVDRQDKRPPPDFHPAGPPFRADGLRRRLPAVEPLVPALLRWEPLADHLAGGGGLFALVAFPAVYPL